MGLVQRRADTLSVCFFKVKILEKRHIIKENKVPCVTRERDVMSRLDHPFFVKLYFTFQDDEKLCILVHCLSAVCAGRGHAGQAEQQPLGCGYPGVLSLLLNLQPEFSVQAAGAKIGNGASVCQDPSFEPLLWLSLSCQWHVPPRIALPRVGLVCFPGVTTLNCSLQILA